MKRWTHKRCDVDTYRSLARNAGISELVASLLVSRGVFTPEAAAVFLDSNLKDHLRPPSELPGCVAVAKRLIQNIREKKKIVIYGDYDVDGITGIVILCRTLRSLGANVDFYVPGRLDEGYGLNSEAVQKLAAAGTNVILTVDCGINSIEEAETAKRCGIELLVSDHHTIGVQLPDVSAICHAALPLSSDNPELHYPFPQLCGAAVALKIAWAIGQLTNGGLNQSVSPKFREMLKEMVGLAALGTVADFVPLLDENRALVRSGLQFLTPKFASQGLCKLLEKANYRGDKTPMTTDFVAFQIAPRINAVGRLGQAGLAVELLLSGDAQRTTQIAQDIEAFNEERKRLEREILREADTQIREKYSPDDAAFVLAGNWHRGVIGIVAGRLVERFHRPVIMLGRDKMGSSAVGSARSVAGFNLYAAIEACKDSLIRFGGHEGAAGLAIEDKNIDAFREKFCANVAGKVLPEERVAELHIDGIFPLGAFTVQTVQEIMQLAPFGCENPHPVFAAENVRVQNVRPMGKENNHFSAEFVQSGGTAIRGIAFTRRDWIEEMQPYNEPMDIAFKVRISDYSGKVEFDILDWRRQK